MGSFKTRAPAMHSCQGVDMSLKTWGQTTCYMCPCVAMGFNVQLGSDLNQDNSAEVRSV